MFVAYFLGTEHGLLDLIFYFIEGVITLIEVGDTLRNSREVSGVTLDEVSKDLDIPEILLEQIEDGNTGAFNDVFVLKDYIERYAKYLGLNVDDVMDAFNTFMFERTSKIPMDKIEEATIENNNLLEKENRVASPYTRAIPKIKTTPYVILLIVAFIAMLIALIWSIRQITIMNTTDFIIIDRSEIYEFTK